jgi:predicted nucleic acid-binding protein
VTLSGDDSARTVVLDACVLIPIRLTITLLALAEAGLFEVLWSQHILDEVERNLPNVGLTPQAASRRVASMRDGFGAAAMVDGFEALIPAMTCHSKDRHVLAAAVAGGADTLVTFNLKDFPDQCVAEHGIDVVHPDTFLARLLAEHTNEVLTVLDAETARLRKPPRSTREFLASLTTTTPMFANMAADAATNPRGPVSPIPALEVANEEEAIAQFGEPGDFTNPAQVGFSFWTGLLEDLELARTLTFDKLAWGDYRWAIGMLADKALASKVIAAVDAPGLVAFMRFVPDVADTARVFATFNTSATVLTLVRVEDGTWRAWGLGPAMPAARDVLGPELASAAQFTAGGGTALVFDWLTAVADDDPPMDLIWGRLDDPLRLAFAQSWLLAASEVDMTDPDRDARAEALAAREGTHPLFARMYQDLVAHFHDVYSDIDGKPCLTNVTETVSVDLELIAFGSEQHVGSHPPGVGVPMHTFLTRHVGADEWVIAANARRLPVPGWPPTERTLEGLLIDGN